MKMVAQGIFVGSEIKAKKDNSGSFLILRFLDAEGRSIDFVSSDLNMSSGLEKMKHYHLSLNYRVNGSYKAFDIISISAA